MKARNLRAMGFFLLLLILCIFRCGFVYFSWTIFSSNRNKMEMCHWILHFCSKARKNIILIIVFSWCFVYFIEYSWKRQWMKIIITGFIQRTHATVCACMCLFDKTNYRKLNQYSIRKLNYIIQCIQIDFISNSLICYA